MQGRVRLFRPEIYANLTLESLDKPTCFRLFCGLINHADREGRLEYHAKTLDGLIFPTSTAGVEEFEGLIAKLESACDESGPFIRRYTVGSRQYLEICNFTNHQTVHANEKKSTLPPNPDNSRLKTVNSSLKTGVSRLNPGVSPELPGLAIAIAITDPITDPIGNACNARMRTRDPEPAPAVAAASKQSTPSLSEPLSPYSVQCRDGVYKIPVADIARYKAEYPRLNVPDVINTIQKWCFANPTKLYAEAGTPKFIDDWFARQFEPTQPEPEPVKEEPDVNRPRIIEINGSVANHFAHLFGKSESQ